MAKQTYSFETVTLNGTETVFEISETRLHTLAGLDVVKLNADSTCWVLNEDSAHYEVALILLSLGEEEDDDDAD